MIKNIIGKLILTGCIAAFFACEKQKEIIYPDIKIGKEEAVSELSLNKKTEKKLLVSGGNGKYKVNVENSRVATATMSADTLKVTGLLEGETFATIISHDKRARLKISVIFSELGVSQTSIQLRPGFRNKTISISGGGERITLEENDPSDAIDAKWDGATGMLEINPKYEGEAEVTVISEDGKEKRTIQIKVKPEGELKNHGWYGTNRDSYYLIHNNKMVVTRKGVGTWIINSARPYKDASVSYGSSYIKIAPIENPIQGDSINLNILGYETGEQPRLKTGIHRLYVEEVRPSEVMLRGRGFKFLLPYGK